MVSTPRLLLLLASAVCLLGAASGRDYQLTVAPSPVDRAGQVVTVPVAASAPRPAELRDALGAVLPVEISSEGVATFVVPWQKAGETRRFTLAPATTKSPPGVEARRDPARVHLSVNSAPLLDFQLDPAAVPRPDIKPEFRRAGYIHPVFSPAGRVVTDDYPSNHVHHHGIWTPWTKTRFQGRSPDFWNMGTKTGREELVSLVRTWSGVVRGGFEAKLAMVDLSAPAPVVALHENWVVTGYQVAAEGGARVQMFDLVVTQTCATPDPVDLPTYHYGGFGFRGAGEWNGPGAAALFLTSEGETDRIKGNNTRGRWCYLGGRLDGAVAGTAILGHPDNFRAPQPMRLHPDMPYMSFVPQQLGDFAIVPGRPYVARFRFIVADGAPDRARLDAYWQGYAQPAVVKVIPVGSP
jgi:hypothetical protein